MEPLDGKIRSTVKAGFGFRSNGLSCPTKGVWTPRKEVDPNRKERNRFPVDRDGYGRRCDGKGHRIPITPRTPDRLILTRSDE